MILLDKFIKSDIVVMATPVYGHNVTGIMKTFTDRLRRCTAPIISRTNRNTNFKPVIGICYAGGGGGGAEPCCVSLKKVLAHCGFEVIDMLPVRRQNLPIKLNTLKSIGEWLVDHVTTGEWERVIPRPTDVT